MSYPVRSDALFMRGLTSCHIQSDALLMFALASYPVHSDVLLMILLRPLLSGPMPYS